MLPALLKYWQPIAGVCIVAFSFSAGWAVNGWRWEAKQADALQAVLDGRVKAEQDAAEHSLKLEEKLAEVERHSRTLTRRLNVETRKDAYRCPLPADGLRLLNAARTGNADDATGEPDGPVP